MQNKLETLLTHPRAEKFFKGGFAVKYAALAIALGGGNITRTARGLKVTRQALSNQIRRAHTILNIPKPDRNSAVAVDSRASSE